MPIVDSKMKWRRKRIWMPAQGQSILNAGTAIEGAHTGSPQWLAVTGGFAYPRMLAGDMFNFATKVPYDLDPRATIGVRVHWTHGSATAADTIDWIVTYSAIAEDAALVDPVTALDTTIPQDTVGVALARSMKRTGRGVINADTLTFNSQTEEVTSQWLTFKAEMDATAIDVGAEGVWLLGLELDYYPVMTQSSLRFRALNINELTA